MSPNICSFLSLLKIRYHIHFKLISILDSYLKVKDDIQINTIKMRNQLEVHKRPNDQYTRVFW